MEDAAYAWKDNVGKETFEVHVDDNRPASVGLSIRDDAAPADETMSRRLNGELADYVVQDPLLGGSKLTMWSAQACAYRRSSSAP